MTNFLKTLSEKFGKMGMKLGLENMQKLDMAFHFPSRKFSSIHVTGTNGKGSVTTKIAFCLQKSNLKVGLYTSPHIACYRERIRIDGQMICESEAEGHLTAIFETAKTLKIEPTFFECMTMVAFLHFAKNNCDVAVIEVGMGGKYDATNILKPLLSIITTIELDHTRYLGKTLADIAEEKSGIIKPKCPVLVGPKAGQHSIFSKVATTQNSPYHELKGTFENYEMENRAIAQKALELLPFENISKEGLEITPPCRFEIFNGHIVLDVAHNPGGFNALLNRLNTQFPEKKIRLLLGLGMDKEIIPILELLSKNVHFIHLTEAKSERAAKAEQLAGLLLNLNFQNHIVETNIRKAFAEAKRLACENDEVLVVCGTFYIMAEVREALGFVEAVDQYLVTPY
jgi:dihydrofolate synthase/folylpolyglutamate synthase